VAGPRTSGGARRSQRDIAPGFVERTSGRGNCLRNARKRRRWRYVRGHFSHDRRPSVLRSGAAACAEARRLSGPDQAAIPLERALAGLGPEIENWDLQAALWWSLLLAERFSVVEAALESLRERVNRSGISRALVAVYSTLGLLKFRLGAL